jgi:succinate dehydrogenase / fumarate reductase flavoprotein subunit
VKGLGKGAGDVPSAPLDAERARQEAFNARVLRCDGPENVYALHRELGELMTAKVGVVRVNAEIDEAIAGIRALRERFWRIGPHEASGWANATLPYARQVHDMMVLAEVIAVSARKRDEFRGSHYKPEFEIQVPPGRKAGDPEYEAYVTRWRAETEKWLKTTVARATPEGPEISYRPVDISVLAPEQPRDYR